MYAIEVKHSTMIHEKDLKGLKSFCQDYPEATPILLYCGKDRLLKNGVLCLPVNEFLMKLTPLKDLI